MIEADSMPYLRPAFLSAILAVVTGFVLSALLTLAAYGPQSPIGLARGAGQALLVAQGAGMTVGDVHLGAVPIGGVMLTLAVATWAGKRVANDPIEDMAAFAASAAGLYGVLSAILAVATSTSGVHTSAVRAAASGFVIGGLGCAMGAASRHGRLGDLWFSAGPEIRAITRSAGCGVLAVVVPAALILLVLLVTNIARAGDMWALLNPGLAGGIALAALNLLLAPTAVLWVVSALLGPGFALGTDTTVDLTGAHLGMVPGFPLFAALPSPGEFPSWVFVLALVPVIAGMAAGWSLRLPEVDDLLPKVGCGAGAGALSGLTLGILVAVSRGALGPGRMADVGPPLWTPLMVAVLVLGLGGALGAALAHYRGARAHGPTRRPRLRKRHQSSSAD